MSAAMLSRSRGRRRNRRTNPRANRPQPVSPILITDAADSGSVLTVMFNQPVMLQGTPAYTTNVPGLVAVSAARTAPNTVAITFSGALAGSGRLIIPFRDPAIRNASGGFVASDRFDFA